MGIKLRLLLWRIKQSGALVIFMLKNEDNEVQNLKQILLQPVY
jgi:hypothetical protein